MNLPNKLSIARIVMVPIFALAFYLEFDFHYLVAGAIFAVAAFTDFLDGYIARKHKLITDLGKFLDSSADKVLVLTTLVLILDGGLLPNIYGGIGVSIIVAREIMVSCLRMVAAAKGVVMAADKFGKIKTVCQDAFIIILLVASSISGDFGSAVMIVAYVLFGLSILLTLASGINYLFKNKAVLSK